MDNRNTRWSLEATVDPNDKIRLRSFIRNEIAYYNALLVAFGSRVRTMPEIFSSVDQDLLGEIAAHGYNIRAFTAETLPVNLQRFRGKLFDENGLTLSDRVLLLLDGVSVAVVLHPEVRRSMALEIFNAHARQAESLHRTSSKLDQVLVAPVELLHPIEARTKRHIQLPRSAFVINEAGTEIRSAYNGVPIRLTPALPAEFQWNLLLLKDEDRPDEQRWVAEFRNEKVSYLVKQSDPPLIKKRRKEFAR